MSEQWKLANTVLFHKDWFERANNKLTIIRQLVLVNNAYLSFSSPVPSLT